MTVVRVQKHVASVFVEFFAADTTGPKVCYVVGQRSLPYSHMVISGNLGLIQIKI